MDKYTEKLRPITNQGPSYYAASLPKTIPEEDVPFFYTAIEGDRLDLLSNTFYKSPSFWWVIAKANNLTNGSIAVPAGTKLYIPRI